MESDTFGIVDMVTNELFIGAVQDIDPSVVVIVDIVPFIDVECGNLGHYAVLRIVMNDISLDLVLIGIKEVDPDRIFINITILYDVPTI